MIEMLVVRLRPASCGLEVSSYCRIFCVETLHVDLVLHAAPAQPKRARGCTLCCEPNTICVAMGLRRPLVLRSCMLERRL